jgi:hypothetical protein
MKAKSKLVKTTEYLAVFLKNSKRINEDYGWAIRSHDTEFNNFSVTIGVWTDVEWDEIQVMDKDGNTFKSHKINGRITLEGKPSSYDIRITTKAS